MKYVITLITIALCSCSSYDYVVDSDYSYSGTFNRYKTFSFAKNENFKGSEVDGDLIEKYMGRTLQSWGYDIVDKRPNLIVFYTMYFEDLEFHSYSQPEFVAWIQSQYRDDELIYRKDTVGYDTQDYIGASVIRDSDETYQTRKLALREGTLLISLFDRKKKRTVWQGYASGIFGTDQDRNERVIKSAVVRILDEYRVLAFQNT